jgi:ABC-type ATPase involved in cell division
VAIVIELLDVALDHPRGGPPIVAGASFKVARGEIALIVGAAGVGTSRLVAAMLGEVPTSAGRIEVFGHDVAKLRRASLRLLRRRVGIVPQSLCLLEDRSAQLNVALPLEIDGVPRSMTLLRAADVLGRLGLDDEAALPVDRLSGSARQRVAVARALVRDPEIVLADHPTSQQDAAGAELVADAFGEAAGSGAAVIAFGRDPALREIADRRGWRTLGLIGGALLPMAEIPLDPSAIDDLLVAIESLPVENVVQFPAIGVA